MSGVTFWGAYVWGGLRLFEELYNAFVGYGHSRRKTGATAFRSLLTRCTPQPKRMPADPFYGNMRVRSAEVALSDSNPSPPTLPATRRSAGGQPL